VANLGTSLNLNPKLIIDYFHPLDTPPTMPCYYTFDNEKTKPICNCDGNTHTKSTCHGLILQHQPTINPFIQNLPCKASDATEREIKNDGDASFQNLTLMRRMSLGIAFQNSA
jgi:hypothetical protein